VAVHCRIDDLDLPAKREGEVERIKLRTVQGLDQDRAVTAVEIQSSTT
jgi:hypothetical protein